MDGDGDSSAPASPPSLSSIGKDTDRRKRNIDERQTSDRGADICSGKGEEDCKSNDHLASSYNATTAVLCREYRFEGKQPLSSGSKSDIFPIAVTKSLVSVTDSFFFSLSGAVSEEKEDSTHNTLYGDGSSSAMISALRRLAPSPSERAGSDTGKSDERDDMLSLSLEEIEEETICGLTDAALLMHSDENDGEVFRRHRTYTSALEFIQSLGSPIPRRVCQKAFRKNDIVWACRTCQTDRTCVLCHYCYTSSDHSGHDVVFYRAQSGGCCDCGDADAWDPKGFCSRHGAEATDEATEMVGKAKAEGTRGAAEAVMDWIAKEVLGSVEPGLRRANGKESCPDPAWHLGDLGRKHSGLYLVLHADDVSWSEGRSEALRELYTYARVDPNLPSFIPPRKIFPHSEEVIFEIATLLFRSYGDLIMWGTNELVEEAGYETAKLWKEEDEAATRRIGELMLQRSKLLSDRGLICSIKTHAELLREGRAAAALDWLNAVAQSCDPLSLQVGSAVSDKLPPVLRCNLFLPRRIASTWNSLLLTLVAAPTFKGALAGAYVDAYRDVAYEYARGIGSHHWSSYALSVQFLNRASYVKELARGKNLMETIVSAFLEMLHLAVKTADPSSSYSTSGLSTTDSSTIDSKTPSIVDPLHTVLTQYRYHPILSDLRLILDVPGIARLASLLPYASSTDINGKYIRNDVDESLNKLSFIDGWIKTLAICQNMDGQVWRTWGQTHVESEHQSWMGAFMLSVSMGDIFERLLAWNDNDPCPIELENKNKNGRLLSASELTVHIMSTGLYVWQASEINSYKPTANIFDIPQPRRCPSSLPYSTISVQHGTDLAMSALPVAQVKPFSFHIPLHRFVAACLREVARRPNTSFGLDHVLTSLSSSFDSKQLELFLQCLVEFPIIVLSRVAQIRSGLWKRNGYCMDEQVSRYDEQEYCRSMKDADLLLVQFGIVAISSSSGKNTCINDSGCAYITNLLVHRFGLFDFAGFDKAPDCDIERYLDEVKQGLYQSEVGANDRPWTYTPAKEPSSFLALLEQLLQLFIIIATELPPPYLIDRSKEANQAKMRLRREVIHKLVSGPKSHSELTEIFTILSKRDNNILNDKFKMADDAMGAALEGALSEVAERKASRGKGDIQQWELQRHAWAHYDPCFYHMSLKSHQIAAERRPSNSASALGSMSNLSSEPYAPRPPAAHNSFSRIRRDLTSDSSVLALAYRTLHVHCRNAGNRAPEQSANNLRGKNAYERKAMSERVLAHAVHLLTLGAYAWQEQTDANNWRSFGGGGKGSIFFRMTDAPTVTDWVRLALLANPNLTKSDWYAGEECSLLLLRRLAHDGGNLDGFVVQDAALRSGAMWLCRFASEHSSDAAALLSERSSAVVNEVATKPAETERERKIRMAKERFERMKLANKKKIDALVPNDGNNDNGKDISGENSVFDSKARLMKEQPQCSICFDNDASRVYSKIGGENTEVSDCEEENSVLTFCGYAQPSLVLKGGGGLPYGLGSQTKPNSTSSHVSRLVGTHITLCGHALHSACSNFHLKAGNKHSEFQCPMCKRLCNCLVPFVDIEVDWIGKNKGQYEYIASGHEAGAIVDGSSALFPLQSMHGFLSTAHWFETVRSSTDAQTAATAAKNGNILASPFSDGATNVCRKMMSLIEDVSYEADIKRLGKDDLTHDPGEFRFLQGTEDMKNRTIWDKITEWPKNFPLMTPSDRDISKEKLMSKLLLSIQAFTYTCCSEAAEVRRRVGQDCEDVERMCAKFGVHSVKYGGKLIVLPKPSATEDDGHQPFKGRFGKLRYLALSIMVAASSASQVIVQNLLDLPAQEGVSCDATDTTVSQHSSTINPLICGHVLSHIVAAMCAACGETWGKKNSNATTAGKSAGDTQTGDSVISKGEHITDSVLRDCESFIGLGFLARVLQIFFGSIHQAAMTSDDWGYHHLVKAIIKKTSEMLNRNTENLNDKWQLECSLLINVVLSTENNSSSSSQETKATVVVPEKILEVLIAEASAAARKAGIDYLLDAAVVLQVLAPGWGSSNGMLHIDSDSGYQELPPEKELSSLMGYCKIEPISKMLESSLVQKVITWWYMTAKNNLILSEGNLKVALGHQRALRISDWPKPANFILSPIRQKAEMSAPFAIQTKSKKNHVPLLGGFYSEIDNLALNEHCTSVDMLPTSYTDLYATLGTLCPEFEQTALCMVCGKVLNACLDKECIKHSYHCGAGSGVFFLLQKCVVLITHKTREAYIQSPFVDSHGETSQYSGRPLNLDIDRYEILREMWCGHQIYERVLTEQ